MAAFAKRVDVAHNTIRKIAYGQRQPSLELAALIERETGGEVTLSDMVIPAGQRSRPVPSTERVAA